jgi:hypothetical protein
MSKDEAIKLALEALRKNIKHLPVHFDDHFEAIKALEQALAEQHLQDLHDENVRLGLYEQGEPTGMLHIDRLDKWLDASLNKRKQRTWVDLTDDEISACSKGHMTRNAFARAIEAKLKQKNTSEAKLKESDI